MMTEGQIEKVYAREILDSRGNPTIEVDLTLQDGTLTRAGVPSGASTGSREAVELRDNDPKRYHGKGVLTAVGHVNTVIGPQIVGMDCRQQEAIDGVMRRLDGTVNKSHLGANAILGVSIAVARAAARTSRLPFYRYIGGMGTMRLPVPMMNIINGGVHAQHQGADFQEYMIAPYGAPTLHDAVRMGSEIYQSLKDVLLGRGLWAGIGDEGGFAPHVTSNRQPLDLIVEAIEGAGWRPGTDVGIAMDPASSEFYRDGKYHLRTEGADLSSQEMVQYYVDLVKEYPICLLEDGLAEDDWSGWAVLNQQLGHTVELVGDDIFCTNPSIIARAIKDNIANAALIKANQIGTLTETIAATRLAQFHGWGAFVSHRSGETTDSLVADLTVGLDTGHLKTGAPARGERVEKYNQLLRIEESMGDDAVFAGKLAFCRPVRF